MCSLRCGRQHDRVDVVTGLQTTDVFTRPALEVCMYDAQSRLAVGGSLKSSTSQTPCKANPRPRLCYPYRSHVHTSGL